MRRQQIAAVLVGLALAGCGTQTVPVQPLALRAVDGSLMLQGRTGVQLISGLKRRYIQLEAKGELPPEIEALIVPLPPEGLPIPLDKLPQKIALKVTKDGLTLTALGLPAHVQGAFGLAVYAPRPGGGLAGSGFLTQVDGAGGTGALSLDYVANTSIARIVSQGNINVSDNTIVAGAEAKIETGFLDGLPGVEHVDIELSGPAYGDGQEVARLASLRAPSFQFFLWDPALPSGTFDPAKLVRPNAPVGFTLTMKAYGPYGTLVGTETIASFIVGLATVSFGVRP